MENKKKSEYVGFLREKNELSKRSKFQKNNTIHKLKKWKKELKNDPSKVKVKKRNWFSLMWYRFKKYRLKRKYKRIEKKYFNHHHDLLKKMKNNAKRD